MRELARELHLALEAGQDRLGREPRADQLDRGRPAQERVARAVDGAHAALADLVLERVLAEAGRAIDFLLEAVQAARRERDRRRDQQQAAPEHAEGPAHHGHRLVRLGAVDLGHEAEAPPGKPLPRPHHRDAAVVAVAVRVDAGAARHYLGHRPRQRPGPWRSRGCAPFEEGMPGIADLEGGRRSPPGFRRQQAQLRHLLREP